MGAGKRVTQHDISASAEGQDSREDWQKQNLW
jgi:hypothetical protein